MNWVNTAKPRKMGEGKRFPLRASGSGESLYCPQGKLLGATLVREFDRSHQEAGTIKAPCLSWVAFVKGLLGWNSSKGTSTCDWWSFLWVSHDTAEKMPASFWTHLSVFPQGASALCLSFSQVMCRGWTRWSPMGLSHSFELCFSTLLRCLLWTLPSEHLTSLSHSSPVADVTSW